MKKDFGTILQQQYGLRAEDLQDARKVKREKGGSLGDILIQRELISETDLLNAYSLLYDIPFWPELPMESLGSELVERVPIHFLKKHTMVPLAVRGGLGEGPREEAEEADKAAENLLEASLLSPPLHIIAVHDPTTFQPLDDLVRMLDLDDHTLVLSTRSAITAAINIFFDASRDSAEQLVQDMEEDGSDIISEIEDTADLLEDTSDAPIIKLVNHIISQSTKARASDIHIEPYQDSFKVRYRVDGILYDLLSPPKWIQPALTSRIKVMAKLNIAEKRLPQDGRFEVKVGSQVVDVRVSTLPTQFGERVVMRLLNKSGSILEMSELGLSGPRLNQMKQLVSSPNGIILVTGPTGSGKTTSLYATLNSINTPDINIITIEDPVEYQLQGISQIQVNPKIDLTFARGLRSIVRQDPDVILVGEIRDRETAEIAVQSALTGHLVFSTLHTNDSASAITRLVDIGVEPFLISSSVLAVIAQRLVRVLCEHCKAPEENVDAISVLGVDAATAAEHSIYRAVGCEQCFQTGYRGRIAIFEIMTMSATLKSLIQKTYDSFQIKEQAGSEGMVTLRSDGVDKVLSGITTIEEVIRVTQI
jgi:general secretion pathway protein E